jgi:hypothetical protein
MTRERKWLLTSTHTFLLPFVHTVKCSISKNVLAKVEPHGMIRIQADGGVPGVGHQLLVLQRKGITGELAVDGVKDDALFVINTATNRVAGLKLGVVVLAKHLAIVVEEAAVVTVQAVTERVPARLASIQAKFGPR